MQNQAFQGNYIRLIEMAPTKDGKGDLSPTGREIHLDYDNPLVAEFEGLSETGAAAITSSLFEEIATLIRSINDESSGSSES